VDKVGEPFQKVGFSISRWVDRTISRLILRNILSQSSVDTGLITFILRVMILEPVDQIGINP
jgi:hypothetical protein